MKLSPRQGVSRGAVKEKGKPPGRKDARAPNFTVEALRARREMNCAPYSVFSASLWFSSLLASLRSPYYRLLAATQLLRRRLLVLRATARCASNCTSGHGYT